jgi:FkbM family methyltransferase
MMATRCPQGHVYAFEASPKNAARRNIEINGLTNVTVIEGALADEERDVDFVETHAGSGNHVITPARRSLWLARRIVTRRAETQHPVFGICGAL